MTLMESITRAVVRLLLALPTRVQQWIAGSPVEIDGHRLYTEVAMALRLLNAMPNSDFTKLPLPEARAHLDSDARIFGAVSTVAHVEDITVPRRDGSVPARSYRNGTGELGTIVYYHGGGWVLGSLDSTDSVARFIAAHLNVLVISVDYRLAPEHPFPAAVHDAIDAYRWARKTYPGIVAVAGDSAGGNLSAVVSNETRDDPPDAQLLFFPVTDLANESKTYETFADGYFLTRAHMRWYAEHYTNPSERADPRVSPLLADLGDAKGVPPAIVYVAGFDVLRDEGVAYANKLKEAGVPTTLKVIGGHIHAFVNSTGVGVEGKKALGEAVEDLRGVLNTARVEKAKLAPV